MSVGWPAYAKLHQFGRLVYDAFGEYPFQVGSSLEDKLWRDVDVVCILPDCDFDSLDVGGDPCRAGENARWTALCWAFSELGKSVTGLPIDFKIQSRTFANDVYGGKPRNALGIIPFANQHNCAAIAKEDE